MIQPRLARYHGNETDTRKVPEDQQQNLDKIKALFPAKVAG
ncbi:hypothetical protein [Levilactobacillus lindianensis]|nr:hypothetical protein [Levilactobacillus lindianensis]